MKWPLAVLTAALLAPGVPAFAQVAFDDRPAEPRQWGFRPLVGETLAANPANFSWRPQENARRYLLQVARDEQFADLVYDRDDLDLTVHTPPVTLPVDEALHWRVAFVNAEGEQSAWSETRHFSVAPDAVEFPMPAREELLAGVPREHPRLFIRPEDLPRLRELAQGEMRAQYEALVRRCEQLLADPPPTEEPEKYPEGMVRGSDEWRSVWWGNRTYTIAVLDGAATLAFTRLLDGNEAYGEKARELLMAAAEWDPVGATGYRYNDEAGMPYNYYFSRTYTFLYDLLTEHEREKCREVMQVRGLEMYRHLYPRHIWSPYGSHANRAWHFLGEVAIAFMDEIEGTDDWLWFAANVFFNVYPVWSDDDGGWHEGAAYWSSYLGRVTWWLDVQRAALGIDGYRKPFFSNAGEFALYTMPPYSTYGGFSDLAPRRRAAQNAGLMSIFAAQAQNPWWQGYVEAVGGAGPGGGYIGFVRGMLPEVEPRSLAELPTSKVFRGVGIAQMHTDITDWRQSVQVTLKSSPMGTQSHGYEAQNAFLLMAYGEPLLIRTGQRDSHGSEHHRQWMWSTRSVNSITVNGQDQIRHSAAAVGRIAAFESSPDFDYAVGEAGDAYSPELLTRFDRHVLFVKPDLVVILDDLEAPEPSTFEYRLHAATQMRIGGQGDIEVAVGDSRCAISFLAPDDLDISQTDRMDPPPRPRIQLVQYHLTAATTTRAERQQFVALYRPHRAGQRVGREAEVARVEGGYALRAQAGDGYVVVLWRTDPGALGGFGMSTDAQIAAARLDAEGNVQALFVHGGERLDIAAQ